MLLYPCMQYQVNNPENVNDPANPDSNLKSKLHRKEKILSPPIIFSVFRDIRAFLFAPLRGAMTVEAALVLPLFLFLMIGALQYGNAMEAAVKFGTAMSETGKSMAAAAYASRYGGSSEGISHAAGSVLSAVYAKRAVVSKAGSASSVKNVNMALSSFLDGDEMIDLVLTYQIKSPMGLVKLPGNFFLQRARVRAWTGRVTGGESGKEEGQESGDDLVYVTATGSVYHEDPDCTHLKLSIRQVDYEALETLRNNGGGKYHACEKCGPSAQGTVYITNEGDRYHSSLSCGGLKRTVTEVHRDECELRACSKCGKN